MKHAIAVAFPVAAILALFWVSSAQITPPPATGGGPPTGACGGDLGGTYPNCTVTGGSHITNSSIANSGLANPATTVNGKTCTLGSSCAPTTSDIAEGTNLYYTNARVVTELGVLNATSQTGRCTGTAYTLTATLAQVACGTTQPTVTISTAGTYLLLFNARIDHIGATYAANRAIVVSLQRSNNTPTALFQSAVNTGIITTITQTANGGNLAGFITYTTSNTNDAITLFASVAVLPTAGSSIISDGDVLALRIF